MQIPHNGKGGRNMTLQEFIRLERRFDNLLKLDFVAISYNPATLTAAISFKVEPKVWVQRARYTQFAALYDHLLHVSNLHYDMINKPYAIKIEHNLIISLKKKMNNDEQQQ